MLGILLGLGSALGYGCLDVGSAIAARKLNSVVTLLATHLLSLCLLLLLVAGAMRIGRPIHRFTLIDLMPLLPGLLGIGFLLGTCNMLGNIALLRAFAHGPVSVVSPLVSAYGLVPLLLGVFWLHEPFSVLSAGGLTLLLMGMVCVVVPATEEAKASTSPSVATVFQVQRSEGSLTLTIHPASLRSWWTTGLHQPGIWWALVTLGCFGLETFVMSRVSHAYGPVWPLFSSRLSSCVLLALVGVLTLGHARGSEGKERHAWGVLRLQASWRLLGLLGCMSMADLAAAGFFAQGARVAPTSLLASLSLLYPAFPMAFGLLVYKERLSTRRWAGIALLFVGLLGLGLSASS